MKKLSFLLLCTVLAFVFTGCKSKQSTEKSADVNSEKKTDLVISIASEPETGFDPCTGWGRYGSPLIQSTLIEFDADLNIINDLAESYTISPDSKEFTFKLRKDAYFTDGAQVTAKDVVFTFKTAQNSGSIIDFTNLEKIEALDNFTVKFILNKPMAPFLYSIAATGIVPAHLYNSDYGSNPIGSGPYKLEQWKKGEQAVLVINENYYRKKPAIKKVTALFIPEDLSIAYARSGKIDVAYTSPSFAAQNISGMKLVNLPTIDNRGITMPVLKNTGEKTEQGFPIGNDVTSDIAIRRALSYGIDRDNLVKNVLNGYGRPAYTECDSMPWWNPETVVEYNIQKAKNILAQAGWKDTDNDGILEKNGIKAEFNLLYLASGSARQALATAVREEAKKLGISINLIGSNWDDISTKMYKDPVLMGWGAQDPLESYYLYYSANKGRDFYNPEYFSNPQVDAYMEQALKMSDPKDSFVYWKKAQWDGKTGTATQGEAPFVWLVNVDHLYFIKNGLNIGRQKIHPHGHAWPLFANLVEWTWE